MPSYFLKFHLGKCGEFGLHGAVVEGNWPAFEDIVFERFPANVVVGGDRTDAGESLIELGSYSRRG